MENFGNAILLEGSGTFVCGTLRITWQFPPKCNIVFVFFFCARVCVTANFNDWTVASDWLLHHSPGKLLR